ncbi:flagellar biosynthesis anti-sigma factor FlgM [Verminephrobacter aporrectodeae]|uniref:Negative regulator of flagellin synthesis n=1 Tax=Verminephrobacter aporrectodeae subsp. tuberculatae TaxID=1110392 RepID=A0ABT3KXH6_9BURK|nr:flagellar biosynthesis anti-sigma factor FlgM [Verminephrobacter aporrectodeae]MCW5221512.1 flagellar biosynthesis anti-sigma factor FlgM [Verminephrobacter aporrectodeae subsp. tuberculatae]MCW5257826.1 flagellar biosynthesis anti-sigma factor FlgM [Verminephrobacter aporrectodeae subsp. tuberculatae]MCW5290803.1 flagellar biosynthesis anti-sigma factor FlgM [Verminephrobacter aporrectodeae subsp. tuberculatae]MCW5323042.1 flagellar biosynthesis anti-sigma factor FlgM [Verminephrobacter apo
MKIGQKTEIPGALAQTGSAKRAQSPPGAAVGAGTPAASLAGVPVTVSGAAHALDPTARSNADYDAGKVQSVRSALEKGNFRVSAQVVATRMISDAQEILARTRV